MLRSSPRSRAAAPLDGSLVDTPPVTSCLGRWLDDTVTLGAPTPIAELARPMWIAMRTDSASDGDPTLSADGCRLYFASDRSGNWELYVAAVTPL